MDEKTTRWLLAVALVIQLFLLSAQVRSAEPDRSVLESALVRMVSPVARTVKASVGGLSNSREYLKSRRRLREENRQLRTEVDELRRERVRSFGIEDELGRLSSALRYERLRGSRPRVADVVHLDYRSWQQTLVLYAGPEGAERQQPVVTASGLVGRVVVPAGSYAKVQLVTDRAASVGAMIERSRRQGIVRGAEDGFLDLDFVPLQEEVRVGDRIVTAGIDSVYPRGVPIGTVVSVEPGDELFHRIRLVPAVELGRLDQVYLLEKTELPDELMLEDDEEES